LLLPPKTPAVKTSPPSHLLRFLPCRGPLPPQFVSALYLPLLFRHHHLFSALPHHFFALQLPLPLLLLLSQDPPEQAKKLAQELEE
jgi:hypothetical protein